VSILVPDRQGKLADIVLGYDTAEEYIKGNGPYMGAVVGRCANRIAKGKFSLKGVDYTIAVNNGPNHLHGGIKGFSKVVWDVACKAGNFVTFEYYSADGEEGYPGDVRVAVTYTLNDNNELIMEFSATTDKTTVFNLAGHSYFNLAGEGSGSIGKQELQINARFFTPLDENCVPTGEIRPVKGTPMDFTKPVAIGARIDQEDEQLKIGSGYDHNWVLNHRSGTLELAAIAFDPASGRVMEISTTQPGVQLYTANFMEGEKGKGRKVYNKREAFCLETQHFANSVNIPHFPTVILNPGDTYHHSCVHKFSVK
jgi:aldose 1-epimerase